MFSPDRSSQRSPPGIGVLLVDPRPILLGGLAELVDRHRPRMHVAGQAGNYRDALELAERLRPDVVVASVFQDELDALEAIPPLASRSRVLVLKGMHEPAPVADLLSLGAAGVVIAEQPSDSIVHAILQVGGSDARGKVWIDASGRAAPVPRQPWPDELAARLTARERELIRAVVAHPGAKYLVIAGQLGISEHTVHNHLSSIYQKLNLVNRNDLLLYAVRHGLAGEESPWGRS